MGGSRKIVFVSENNELYKSLKRASIFGVIGNIEISKKIGLDDGLKNISGEEVLIFDGLEFKEDIWRLICRLRNRHCNPFIFLTGDTHTEIESNNKAKAFLPNKDAHKYLIVPFLLNDLSATAKESSPLSEEERKAVYEKYFDWWREIVKAIADHELKNSIRTYLNKERIIKIYQEIKDYIPSKHNNIQSKIEQLIKKVESLPEKTNLPGFIDNTKKEFKTFIKSDKYKSFLKLMEGK